MNKFIDFIITQKCNQNCTYCSQSKQQQKKKNHATKETIKAFFDFIETLDKDFEITITGGEALLHPNFFEIIEKLAYYNFKINLISNFSFNLETYQKIFSITKENLNKLDISLHLDEIKDFSAILMKLEQFLKSKPKYISTTILIPIFKLDQIKEEKIKKINLIAEKYNTNIDFQHIRILNKFIKYNKDEEKYFSKKEKIEKTYAHYCTAGSKSAVIYEDGSVYRCYSSRFLIKNYLGNIKDKNFKLYNKPKVCTQKCCTCPKPKQYNQILSKKNYLKAFGNVFINYINMPLLVLKNKDIIKNKLEQFIKIN